MILGNRKVVGLITLLTLLGCALFILPSSGETPANFGSVCIPFTPCGPEPAGGAKYRAGTAGATFYVTQFGELHYSIYGKDAKGVSIKEGFVGSTASDPTGEGEYPFPVTRLSGGGPGNTVPVYRAVGFGSVYEGVSLSLGVVGSKFEKRFRLTPYAHLQNIRIEAEGCENIAVNSRGELEYSTPLGTFRALKPTAYQTDIGGDTPVDVSYVVDGKGYGFAPGDYDMAKELIVIQPLIASFSDSIPDSVAPSVLSDGNGGVTVVVKSFSAEAPAPPGQFDLNEQGCSGELFIAKYSEGGKSLAAGAVLDCVSMEGPNAVAPEASGNVYVAGSTNSIDFPMARMGYDSVHHGAEDVFIAKIDGNLREVLASTLLGGVSTDRVDALAVDSSGNVYVAGRSASPDFPLTTGLFLYSAGAGKAFVTKFDENLQFLLVSVLLDHLGVKRVTGLSAGAVDEPGIIVNALSRTGEALSGVSALKLTDGLMLDRSTTGSGDSTAPPAGTKSAATTDPGGTDQSDASSSEATNGMLGPGWHIAKGGLVSIQQADTYFAKAAAKRTARAQAKRTMAPARMERLATTQSDEISELARALLWDPIAIFDYVYYKIDYVPYFGSLKGATLTLLDGSGNDFDQAALLIALLRAGGYTAQFSYCQVTIPGARMANLLGVDQTKDAISAVIACGGIPASSITDDGTTTLAHMVVKANIGGTVYYFDPAYKLYSYIPKIDIGQAMGFSLSDLLSQATSGAAITSDYVQNLNETGIKNTLTSYSTGLVSTIRNQYPNSDMKQIIGGREIGPYSPLYSDSVSELYVWDEVPAEMTTTLKITHAGIDYTFSTHDLSGKRLTITYNDEYGYAPELRLDGTLVGTAGNATTVGTKYDCTIAIDHPYPYPYLEGTYADQSTVYTLESGRFYSIVYNFAGASRSLIQRRQKVLDDYRVQGSTDDSEAVLGETMHIMGLTHLKQGELAERLMCALADTISIHHHTVGIVAQERAYYVDIRNDVGSIVSKHHDSTDERAHVQAVNPVFSALEHGVLEQMMGSGIPCASTVKLLQVANASGKKIFHATPGNYVSVVKGQLTDYSATDLDTAFPSKLSIGETLILPEDGKLQLNEWRGAGYIGKRFEQGTTWIVEMLIEGGYNGGYASYEYSALDADSLWDTTYTNSSSFDFYSLVGETSRSVEPIDMATGAYLFDHTDLEIAGKPTIGLSFARSYNSRLHCVKGKLGYGWTHSLDIYIKETSHGEPALGCRQPVDAAPFLATLHANLQLFKAQDSLQNWVIASLASKWAVDQTIDNAVTVNLGTKSLEFIKLPDGSYSPPPGFTTTLLRNADGTYSLRERFGTQLNFNVNKQIAEWIDADTSTGQNKTTFTYVGSNLHTVGNTFGNSLTFLYSGDLIVQVSDSTGRWVSFGYTADNLTRYTDPEGKNWGYGYNSSRRMTTLNDPLGITTATNVYDTLGRVMTQTAPRQNGTVTYTYYFAGIRSAEVDPNGYATYYYYDDKGREYAKVDALNNMVYKIFDGQDHLTDIRDQKNQWTSYGYDGNHNVTTMTDPYGNVTHYTYDSQFHLTDVTDPNNNTMHYDYDTRHHLTGTRDPLNNTTGLSYYANGLVETKTDGRNVVTTLNYDGSGNPHTAQTGNRPVLTWDYDARGRLLALTDQNGAQTGFLYDKRGLLLRAVDPLGRSTIRTYDLAGRMSTKQDRNGNTIAYTYTPTGKPATVSYPDTSSIAYHYDNLDNLAYTSDSTGRTDYTYDSMNRLKTVTDPTGFTITYDYDAAGNLSELVYPGNKSVTYTYTAWNSLLRVTNWLGQTANYYYDDAGRCTGFTHFNGTEIYYTQDAANRLRTIDIKYDLSTWIAWYSYDELDGNGNRTRESRDGPLLPPSPATGQTAYGYNAMGNRLLSAGGSGFTYDNEGRLSTGYGPTYTFDFEHRLTGIGGTASYTYNGRGNRVQAVRGAQTTRYKYDPAGNLLAETDSSNQVTKYYIYGIGLLEMATPTDETYCYHFDGTGNAIALTDSTRTVVNAYAYDHFGTVVDEVESIPQPFKFVGQFGVMAEPNGFYYMRARYYDPAVGRFISEDPSGFDGGDVNLFAYVGNNPINHLDSSGLSEDERITRGSYTFVKYTGDHMHGGEHWHVYARRGRELLGRVSLSGEVLTGSVPKTAIKILTNLGKIGGAMLGIFIELALPDEAGANEDMLLSNYENNSSFRDNPPTNLSSQK